MHSITPKKQAYRIRDMWQGFWRLKRCCLSFGVFFIWCCRPFCSRGDAAPCCEARSCLVLDPLSEPTNVQFDAELEAEMQAGGTTPAMSMLCRRDCPELG